jgi:hypothetical protein
MNTFSRIRLALGRPNVNLQELQNFVYRTGLVSQIVSGFFFILNQMGRKDWNGARLFQ